MFIDRKETIERFKKDHQKLKELVTFLPLKQILRKETLGKWSIKDTIAHLATWNWEAINEGDTREKGMKADMLGK